MSQQSHEPCNRLVASYDTPAEAHMVEAMLGSEGIPSFVYLRPRGYPGIVFGHQLVDVLVRSGDEERAKALINKPE